MSQSERSGNDPVIAGTVLPLQRAEELISTLAGVVSVRIVATESGLVDTIHVLTTGETQPKQMVRNVESALMAHLGMRVDHRKVSVATTSARATPPLGTPVPALPSGKGDDSASPGGSSGRTLYFEDVEIRGSRAKGVACKVTLRRGDETYIGEAEGFESDRSRVELAARAALAAITSSESDKSRVLSLEGTKMFGAFDREFVFVGVTVRFGREAALLTGSVEVKDSAETAGVLAVLDATNRWVAGRAT
ncbi:MAG: hypothetical protein ACYC3L_04500 [Gemmatimonadaceae bacterium]